MKERPILFSAPMVRAILEGRKTQTRRIVKSTKVHDCLNSVGSWDGPEDEDKWLIAQCPHGKPGDRLWVRETWFHQEGGPVYDAAGGVIDAFDDEIIYRADRPNRKTVKWKPSIFMPRWASRILLEIIDVRVERLQEIGEADAEAEGIERSHHGNGDQWIDYPTGSSAAGWIYPRDSYRSLWNSINGAGSWDENPYVWVIEFKRVSS